MARRPISAVIADRARHAPDDVLVWERSVSATVAEIDTRATRVARLLIEHGVRRDDRVVISLPNGIEFVVACIATWRAGATPMPLDPDLADDERATIEQLAHPVATFGHAPMRDGIAHLSETQAQSMSTARPVDQWARCWKAPTSSGSTGRPKVIASTAPALVDPDAPVAPFVPHRATQLVSSPMWHSTAFTYAFRGLTAGHRLVIEPSFDPTAFLDCIERHRVSWAVLSPPSIRGLLRLPHEVRGRRDVTSLDSILHLGGRCPEPDKRAMIDWLGADRVVEVYAGSESNGLTMIRGDDWLEHPGSVGRPIGGTEIRIESDDGAVVGAGVPGTIWMRRGIRSSYRYVGATSRRTADGWDTLGDIGYLDDDGYLTVLDREADTIHRGGVTVYPADVEQAFESHPLVRGAVAVGEEAADATSLTVVVDIADSTLTVDELSRFATQRLAPVSRPDRICVTRRPLRNDAGKIRRRAVAGCGRRIIRTNGVPA